MTAGRGRGTQVLIGEAEAYVILLVDPDTGGIEAYGPVDALAAAERASTLSSALAVDEELAEFGVLILPLRPVARPARPPGPSG